GRFTATARFMNALPSVSRPFSDRAETVALCLIVVCAFVVPLPTALISICTFLFLLAWLAAGKLGERWATLRRHPQGPLCLALLTWMGVSIAWSPAPFHEALDNWWHFREYILFLLMLTVVAREPKKWERRILLGYLAGYCVSLLTSYLRWFEVIPLYDQVGEFAGFGGHTGFSLMLAITSYACIWLWRARPGLRVFWLLLMILSLFNLYFINTGRTGQVAFLALIPLIVFRWMGLPGLIAGALGAVAFAGSLYFLSPTVHYRVNNAVYQIEQYRAGNTTTSDGLRIEFWVNAVKLIRHHPILGGGSGSFAAEYEVLAAEQHMTGDHVAVNPHNEYLLMWAQYGLPGLGLFLALWLSQWRRACREAETRRYLFHGLILAMAVGDLFNSLILDNMEGHFYMLVSVALGAAWSRDDRAGGR
ncbi:MAG TPA: O-antigen ligase family protein, partial [Rhodocyclaceae bacterium]|nr:O-antigen ligase family protein [Rhodocyclaceae bacterium]